MSAVTNGDTSQLILWPLHSLHSGSTGQEVPSPLQDISFLSSFLTLSHQQTNSLGLRMLHEAQTQELANTRVEQARPASLGLRPRIAKVLARAFMLEKDKGDTGSYSSANPSWCCVPARSSKLTCPHTTTPASPFRFSSCGNQLVQTHAGSAHTSHWPLIKKISGEQLLFIYSAPCSQNRCRYRC